MPSCFKVLESALKIPLHEAVRDSVLRSQYIIHNRKMHQDAKIFCSEAQMEIRRDLCLNRLIKRKKQWTC